MKSEIVLLRVMKLFREFQVIDIFYQQADRLYYLEYPFTLFNINFACYYIQKFIIALVSWAKNES